MGVRVLVVCLLAGLLVPAVARGQDPVYDASGAQYGRGFFAPLPFERIDTVTGNLFLSFTDLSLPGNGGLGLSVVRTYNSREGRWRIGLGGVPLRVVFNSGEDDVDFVTADGAEHNAASPGNETTSMTQGFWIFTKNTRKLEMPNGLVLTYGHVPVGAGAAFLTEVRDPFDNTLTLVWQAAQLLSVTQHLGGGQSREVTFANWVNDMATSMSFDGRTWSYVGANPAETLEYVAPPGGARWYFTYQGEAQNTVKLKSLTTPNGGTVTYEWGERWFPTQPVPTERVVVVSRTTGGRAPTGTWTFNWQDSGRLLQIIAPVTSGSAPSSIVQYRTLVVDGIPVKTERKVLQGNDESVVETETLTYETLPHPVNPVPGVKTVTLVRGGETYTTTYTYSTDTTHWSNYGQPTQIVESGTVRSGLGPLTRTTAISYNHSFSKYIRGKVASVTTTVDGLATTRSFAYDGVTGFMTSSSELGTTTSYEPTARGNTASVWDPMGRRTNFAYDWGVVSSISSPVSTVAVTRGINVDGTVAWEESTDTARTTYGYDPAGRVTSVASSTPDRVPVQTDYTVTSHQWISTTVTRGAVSVTTTIDGFGRPTHTQDSTGAQSRTTYNAVGQVAYQSQPFGGGVAEAGATYGYDALGRRIGADRHDGSYVSWGFGPVTIGVKESLNKAAGGTQYRDTVQHYHWFKPGDGPMWRLVDAALGDWRYAYNGRGQLTGAWRDGDPNGRSWHYHPATGRLAWTDQPESGITSYQINDVGNVTMVQDDVRTIYYQYDADHRLWKVDAPNTEDDVTTTYDPSGRVKTVANATVHTTLYYDGSSRVTGRTDVILGYTFSQAFFYNGYDNLIRVEYPLSGRTVHYDYDPQQRLTGVRTQIANGPITQLAHTFVYRGDGSLKSYLYGNGHVMQVDRDTRQRPAVWESGPLKLWYSYDDVSNVKQILDERDEPEEGGQWQWNHSSQYTYDLLDRLTEVTGFGATTYTYTPGGDRLTGSGVSFHYDAAKRRLMSLTGAASGNFSYDPVGNMTSDPSGITYTYNAHNQQATSVLGTNTTTYKYGGGGMRAVRQEPAPSTKKHLYLYGPGSGPIAEYSVTGGGSPQITREYVYLGGQLLASFAPSPVSPPPLSVSVVTPANNTTIGRSQTLQLTASVSATGLTIARVEYYNNGLYVGQATSGSYAVTMATNILPATNTIIARVVATTGEAVSSAPVTLIVQ